MQSPSVLLYCNRRGDRVWIIPLAGITVTRPSRIVPAIGSRGLRPRVMSYEAACSVRDSIMRTFAERGIPGKVLIEPYLPATVFRLRNE